MTGDPKMMMAAGNPAGRNEGIKGPGQPGKDSQGGRPEGPNISGGNVGPSPRGMPAAGAPGNAAPIQLTLGSGGPDALTNKIVAKAGGPPPRVSFTNINFSKYAKAELLGDGSAKQALRKLEDDMLISTQEWSQAEVKLRGTQKLYNSNFVSKIELDSDDLSLQRADVKVKSSQTALDLFIKYEFPRAAEEWVSKYDDCLRLLDRTRKEAVSKQAQARLG